MKIPTKESIGSLQINRSHRVVRPQRPAGPRRHSTMACTGRARPRRPPLPAGARRLDHIHSVQRLGRLHDPQPCSTMAVRVARYKSVGTKSAIFCSIYRCNTVTESSSKKNSLSLVLPASPLPQSLPSCTPALLLFSPLPRAGLPSPSLQHTSNTAPPPFLTSPPSSPLSPNHGRASTG